MTASSISEIVSFWRDAGPDRWFAKDEAFDADFRSRFMDDHLAAAARKHDDWIGTPDGSLAPMILLDQFPRNCFRGTGHMVATDPLALAFARRAIAQGHDGALDEKTRLFLYLPFMHSEILADQEECVRLCASGAREQLKYAIDHRYIVARFGRFPHRNAMLGRETTADEAAFLASGGFSG